MSTRPIARILAALTLATALVACAAPKVSLREGPREYVAQDYENVLGQWTRTEHLLSISELDNLLTATATFESWDFRWAYVVRYAQDYRLTLDQRQKLLEKTLDETRDSHHFFVAITGGDRRFNDLTKPDSAWIVRLIDSTGAETAPQDIKAINKPNAIERTYFPYNTVFHRAFRITFPRTSGDGRPTISPNAQWFGLRFAGAQGNSELIWTVDKDVTKKKKTDKDDSSVSPNANPTELPPPQVPGEPASSSAPSAAPSSGPPASK
jgi:hypothetical protein